MKAISRHRTFIMGFAALWIYVFHIFPTNLFGGGVLNELWTHVKRLGFCGVDIFLLVSAFGLTYALDRMEKLSVRGYFSYLARRLKRLYVVILPVALVIGVVDGWSLRGFIGRVTGLAQIFVDVYRFLWYLARILIFYILAPFYYALFRRVRHKGLFTAVCVMIFPIANYFLRDVLRNDLFAITARVSVFLLGFYLGHLSKSQEKLGPGAVWAALASLILGVALNILLTKGHLPWLYPGLNAQINLLIAPGAAILLAWLCDLWADKRFSGLTYRFFVFFGTISFEFYATQEWIWGKVGRFVSSAVLSELLCFALTLAASLALHRLGKYLSALKLVKAE